MISESRVEKAVEFYRDNAERYGQLVGLCKALEQKRKVEHGQQFLYAQGTVAERTAQAESSPAFKQVVEDIENAWAEKTTLEAQLRAAEMTIDVWRSQYSKQGKGHV